MPELLAHAVECIERCRTLAQYSEEPGHLTRRFLSPPMHDVHRELGGWMHSAGMSVTVDAAGNLRGSYRARSGHAPVLLIGSHLDTVPHAGAFDGILGVVIGVELVGLLSGRAAPFAIEVIGFAEEEGVRFGVPFIGSRALIGDVDDALLARTDAQGISVADAVRAFGLDPACMPAAAIQRPVLGYLEFHIEQGPVLEELRVPLGVVEAIAGQTRLDIRFDGRAGHAGTTPMRLRRDSLAGAAEFIASVEGAATTDPDLVATVGRIAAEPGATNVIAGSTSCSLDVRHPHDRVRRQTVEHLVESAHAIAARRGLRVAAETRLEQCAVSMDPRLTDFLARAAGNPHHMTSGAGHDAMIVARRVPSAMLFLRSPDGLSHHPDESVLAEDVAAALQAGLNFLRELEALV
jgi:allantoate deiminase